MVVISPGAAGLVWPDRCISGERVEWSGITTGRGGGWRVSISQYSLITNKTELSSS